MRTRCAASILALTVAAASCGEPVARHREGTGETAPAVADLASPTGPGAMAPWLAADGDELLMTWLEPGAEGGHRFLFSRLGAGGWAPPRQIAAGDDFFANWADVPKVGVAGDGTLWAHWLAKTGSDTYAYGIFLARSADGGATWEAKGTLHDDATPSEHGFVAYAAEGDAVRATWLDGREMPGGGPMTLRTALLGSDVGVAEVLDGRVCECCPTELVATTRGALAFYRDRSPSEVRNIALTRRDDAGWSAPRPLHEDGWTIAGCPVNGPAAAVAGDHVAVAWFTAPEGRARVQLALSEDGGATFGPPLLVDGERPLGRVDVTLDAAGAAWVSWLAVAGDGARLRAAGFAGDGSTRVVDLATTGASRASGIPRLERLGDDLVAAWVATADDRPAAIRLARWR